MVLGTITVLPNRMMASKRHGQSGRRAFGLAGTWSGWERSAPARVDMVEVGYERSGSQGHGQDGRQAFELEGTQ